MVEIKAATEKNIEQIARCHCAAFPASLSSALGLSYVGKMMHWYLSNDHTFLIYINEESKCVGYCGGMVKTIWGEGSASSMAQYSFNSAVKSFLLRPWLIFHKEVRAKFPFILKNLRTRFLTNKNKNTEAKPIFEPYVGLVVIGVDPKSQGKGYGSLLLQEFEVIAKSKGLKRMILSVLSDNNQAIAAYQRNGWSVSEINGKSTSMEKLI